MDIVHDELTVKEHGETCKIYHVLQHYSVKLSWEILHIIMPSQRELKSSYYHILHIKTQVLELYFLF